MKRYLLLFALCTLGIFNEDVLGVQNLIRLREVELTDSVLKYKNDPADDEKVLFAQEIIIDTTAFYFSDTVEIELDNEKIIVVKKNSVVDDGINYHYNAYESNNAHVFISKLESDIHGMIHSTSGTYSIDKYEDIYLLEKIDMDDMPQSSTPILPDNKLDTISSFNYSNRSMAHIRVLVMFTPEVKRHRPNMLHKALTDINNGNTSFLNSDIYARFDLAYVGETIDSENGLSVDQLLNKFQTDGDGVFDEVHSLKNKYYADVCVLYVDTFDYCGLGYINADTNYAFAAVNYRNGCEWNYAFSHEIGHIIGCGHDLGAPTYNSPYTYGHGYVHYIPENTSNSWRTIMAYNNACGGLDTNCKVIPYWSNPDIEYDGNATGNILFSNNARVWNERASIVAFFKMIPYQISFTSADNNQSIYENIVAFSLITTGGGFEVQSGQKIDMSSNNTIRLRSGTHIKNGATFHASIYSNANTLFVPARSINDFAYKEQERNNSLLIKPNPVINILTILTDINLQEVNIYNTNGQMVLQTKETQIDVSHLPKGIYLVRGIAEDGQILQSKLIHE